MNRRTPSPRRPPPVPPTEPEKEPAARVAGPLAIPGLTPSSSAAEAKAAYRELALRVHSDHGGDAAEFDRIPIAYSRALRPAGGAA